MIHPSIEEDLPYMDDHDVSTIIEETSYRGDIETVRIILDYFSKSPSYLDVDLLVDALITGERVYDVVNRYENFTRYLEEKAIKGAILGGRKDVLSYIRGRLSP